MSETVDKRLEIVQNRINQYGMRFPVANIAGRIKFDRGYISAVLNGKKPMSDNFWSKFDEAFPEKSSGKLIPEIQQIDNASQTLPGSVTLQDHIATLEGRRQDAERFSQKLEADKERLYNIIEGYLNNIMVSSGHNEQHLLDAKKLLSDIVAPQLAGVQVTLEEMKQWIRSAVAPITKSGKGLSGQQRQRDGKGSSR